MSVLHVLHQRPEAKMMSILTDFVGVTSIPEVAKQAP